MSATLGHDLGQPSAFQSFLRSGVETVYHLAARTSVYSSWTDPSAFYLINTAGTQKALEFCRVVGARLFYCSAYIYGTPRYLPIDEDHPVQPSSPYAHSKWLGEEICRFYFHHWQVPVTIVRPFNIFGPGQSPRFLIPSLVEQVVRGDVVRIRSTAPRRDFVYISDFLEACLMLSGTAFEGAVFNIGSGRSASVRDVIVALERLVGQPIRVEETGLLRPDEIMEVAAGCRLIREGRWRPLISLDEGLDRMVRWTMGHSEERRSASS
jgi:nucleoside-diphosphate-sugar epimerase